MPCHDYGYLEWLNKQNEIKNTNEEINVDFSALQTLIEQLKFRNNLLSQFLCITFSTLENISGHENIFNVLPRDIIEWWAHHKKCEENK
ncbi:MAG: hypothetical protein A3E87_01540 [Gammaproteobacteria bacterium RIFCSPHIGHO2_12_FULL_35_23]|nr:MAG: hypothetical protein A3E87_01540 [Gammaproteobacteria bacterium RIFCSPHIGHO2_12_FULL_35_23]